MKLPNPRPLSQLNELYREYLDDVQKLAASISSLEEYSWAIRHQDEIEKLIGDLWDKELYHSSELVEETFSSAATESWREFGGGQREFCGYGENVHQTLRRIFRLMIRVCENKNLGPDQIPIRWRTTFEIFRRDFLDGTGAGPCPVSSYEKNTVPWAETEGLINMIHRLLGQ